MQSENFDKKIKDSLSQRPPGNDDPEWGKMETLLDKHMPVEKKDRRRVFFILLFLFLVTGGGAFLIWQNGSGDKNNVNDIKSQSDKIETPVNNKSATETNNTNVNTNSTNQERKDADDQTNSTTNKSTVPPNAFSSNDDPAAPEFTIVNPLTTKKSPKDKNNKSLNENITSAEKNEPAPLENTETGKNQKQPGNDIKTDANPVPQEKNEVAKPDEPKKTTTANKVEGQKTATKESQPITAKKLDPKKQPGKNSFLNNLFFSLSAGPDFSAVGFHNAGKLELAYGAGIGYQISNKFSIRTGFYSARKIYTADPDDYHPEYNVSQYYPNLKTIDANCKVYEIPVMVDYTFGNNKKGSLFVSAGASTILMKEETYDYYFKPNYSPTYVTYTKRINNENKHYFSQLNIAGGYTRNINKNISLRAEPYMKIAMNGVGAGKIKLNSGGVLFSVIIKPFAKK